MNFENEIALAENKINIINLLKKRGLDDLRSEIIIGLISEKKYISSKFFYNETGSRLFEEITHLEEYYPTRTEKSILMEHASEITYDIKNKDIIELGSGDCSKISILINGFPVNKIRSIRYLPVDVSEAAILQSSKILVSKFPDLNILGYIMDFTNQFEKIPRKNPALICFFGSTIGNFDMVASRQLLKNISRSMITGDHLLLGMDLVKPEQVLRSAYNDAKGVTEAFNKNILMTVNNIIQSDFNIKDFDHLAYYNKNNTRIEMHLVANKDVIIKSPWLKENLRISKAESIHTENSHKYSTKNILEFSHSSGLRTNKVYSDSKKWFALVDFEKE